MKEGNNRRKMSNRNGTESLSSSKTPDMSSTFDFQNDDELAEFINHSFFLILRDLQKLKYEIFTVNQIVQERLKNSDDQSDEEVLECRFKKIEKKKTPKVTNVQYEDMFIDDELQGEQLPSEQGSGSDFRIARSFSDNRLDGEDDEKLEFEEPMLKNDSDMENPVSVEKNSFALEKSDADEDDHDEKEAFDMQFPQSKRPLKATRSKFIAKRAMNSNTSDDDDDDDGRVSEEKKSLKKTINFTNKFRKQNVVFPSSKSLFPPHPDQFNSPKKMLISPSPTAMSFPIGKTLPSQTPFMKMGNR